MIDSVFENKYEAELGIERQYWEYHSAGRLYEVLRGKSGARLYYK
jgi:hypothetical protein